MRLHPYAGNWFYLLTGTDVLNRRLFKVWDWAINIHHASWRELAESKELYSSIYAVRQSVRNLPDDEQVVYGNLTDNGIYLVHHSELSEVVLTHEAARLAGCGIEDYRVVGNFLIAVRPNGRKATLGVAHNVGELVYPGDSGWIHEWHYDDLRTAMEELKQWNLDTAEPDRWTRTEGEFGTRVRPHGDPAEEYVIAHPQYNPPKD